MLIPVKPEHRGKVTDELKQLYQLKTKRELTKHELRLLPFILHCVLNGGEIISGNCSIEEIEILEQLDDQGFLFYHPTTDTIAVTFDFYDTICEVLKHSYLTKAIEL